MSAHHATLIAGLADKLEHSQVAHSSVKAWHKFESAFLSAFLYEDYEDELAEKV